ncbi:DNA polymerase III subunit delta [Polynucleobacter sp. IMCC 29146]|uniref:DNA polymerase III subunit delta n=1 Tax=Polynucleobacter sp. IMCC 29146 TaxID=2780953 RepID=UPI001F27ED8F|nr:DNA polymerase III subunit delta [Polynucleobacter sp. IMCC 29146]MCE7528365.1 DNA polymerase III subunit delta [Polynucleobacter sp. IMCC 29146]
MIKIDALQAHMSGLAAATAATAAKSGGGSKAQVQGLYVLSGDEPLLLMEAMDQLRATVKKIGYTEREILMHERYFDWSQLLSVGQTMSLFGDKRWLELRIPSGKPGRDGAEALKQFAAQIVAQQTNPELPETVVCIVLPRIDAKTKTSSWFSALDAAGMVVQVDSLERSYLPHWIAARLKKQGQAVEAGPAGQRALEFMVDQVEGNLIAAHQEIQKLGLLYPEGQLSEAEIRAAILKVARYDIFELTAAMLAGDLARLNRMLDGLKGEGEPLPLILWSVTEELRLLAKLKVATDKGESVQQLLKTYRIWGTREKLYPAALRRIGAKALRRAIQVAAGLDRQAKGLAAAELPADPWDGLRLVGHLLR